MPRPEKLTSDQISASMKEIPLWELINEKFILREIGCENFAKAIGVVNSIAIIAEKAEHHPDILIYGWNKVRLKMTTHDVGGLTENDFNLAKEIDALNF